MDVSASWNPLRCSGTALAPNVLLAAKLVTLCVLATDYQVKVATGAALGIALKGVLILAAAALLLNRSVRSTAVLLGAALTVSALVAGPFVSRAGLFCGLFLMLVGLQRPGREPWAPRCLIVLAYVGAGLGIWIDVLSQTDRLFQFWSATRTRLEFLVPSDALPGGVIVDRFEWASLCVAVVLALAFLFRRAWPYAIWLGIFFHIATSSLGGAPLWHYAMLASYLVFAPWPKESLTILYDGDCGFCETTRRFFERLDFDRMYDWHPFQDGAGEKWGIPTAALERAAHVVADGRIYAGFRAFQALTLYSPLTYFVLAGLLLAARAFLPAAQLVIAVLAIALYFPLFRPLGEAVYQLIARNRHRLPGEKTCKIA